MPLLRRLRRLDARVLRWLRQPDESAEAYLRRVVAIGGVSAVMSEDLVAALREHFATLDAGKRE